MSFFPAEYNKAFKVFSPKCTYNLFSLLLSSADFLFPGILQADTGVIRDNKQMFRLFCHESMRVFHDRLINKEDKGFFYNILSEMAGKHFSEVRNG